MVHSCILSSPCCILLVDRPSGLGLHWAQSTTLRDAYGLRWHVVVVEQVQCDPQTYLAGSEGCRSCPEGAECEGGRSYPVNREGFWGDGGGAVEGERLHEFYNCETLAGATCLRNFQCKVGCVRSRLIA